MLLSSMFKDLIPYQEEREQAEERNKPSWGQKTSSQHFLIKQHVSGSALEEISGRRRHRSPCLTTGSSRRNSKFTTRAVASGKKHSKPPLSKMTKRNGYTASEQCSLLFQMGGGEQYSNVSAD